VGNSAPCFLPSFPSAVGTVENMQFVFHGFQGAAVSIAWVPKIAFFKLGPKKLGPYSRVFLLLRMVLLSKLERCEISTQPEATAGSAADNSVLVRQLRGPNFRIWP